MKMIIDSIGKIRHAELDFNGVTVIAGNNNTGKSTVGKTLFAIFNSLQNLGAKVENQRHEEKCDAIEDALSSQPVGTFTSEERKVRRFFGILPGSFKRSLDFADRADIESKVRKLLERIPLDREEQNTFFQKMWSKIDAVDEIADADIIAVLIDRVFTAAFNGQIDSLSMKQSPAVTLELQHKEIKLEFRQNKNVGQEIPFPLTNKAIFIQSPDVIDSLDSGRAIWYRRSVALGGSLNSQLLYFISRGTDRTAVAEARARKKLEEVYRLLDEVIPGEITTDTEGDFVYNEKGLSGPLSISNLSTGLKSFALLYLLLERGALEDRDVLILDEPEVNLHPEWQLKYAELIVLLQKVFQLTVLLTTHSPYFLRAVEMYSRKHGIENNCNYYLASLDGGQNAVFQDVTGNLESIYHEMARPFDTLNDIDDNLDRK